MKSIKEELKYQNYYISEQLDVALMKDKNQAGTSKIVWRCVEDIYRYYSQEREREREEAQECFTEIYKYKI